MEFLQGPSGEASTPGEDASSAASAPSRAERGVSLSTTGPAPRRRRGRLSGIAGAASSGATTRPRSARRKDRLGRRGLLGGLLGRRSKPRGRRWKILTAVVAVCVGAALLFTLVQKLTLEMVLGFFLYGSPKPYMSRTRQEEVQKGFREMIQKEFGPPKSRLR